MKIKVFVDWVEHEVISEAEYKEKIRQESEKMMANEEYFYDWLGDNYTPQAIWALTEAGRIEVRGFWERECKEIAELESDFEMVTVEI